MNAWCLMAIFVSVLSGCRTNVIKLYSGEAGKRSELALLFSPALQGRRVDILHVTPVVDGVDRQPGQHELVLIEDEDERELALTAGRSIPQGPGVSQCIIELAPGMYYMHLACDIADDWVTRGQASPNYEKHIRLVYMFRAERGQAYAIEAYGSVSDPLTGVHLRLANVTGASEQVRDLEQRWQDSTTRGPDNGS